MDIIKDRINKYGTALVAFLQNFADERNNSLGNTLEYQVIADTKRNHFQLVRLGWYGPQFVYFVLLHLDIKRDGKVWIQQNNTECLLAEELPGYGISTSDLVIGFRAVEHQERGMAVGT